MTVDCEYSVVLSRPGIQSITKADKMICCECPAGVFSVQLKDTETVTVVMYKIRINTVIYLYLLVDSLALPSPHSLADITHISQSFKICRA